jgi:glycosyltransferase involved in cell wall biosynthesis
MPLESNPYTLGKCGFKLMQYMAAGVPTVASPVGFNKEVVQHGRTGFLATEPNEWHRYLELLITDWRLRREMGEKARQVAVERFSYDVWAPRFVSVIEASVG